MIRLEAVLARQEYSWTRLNFCVVPHGRVTSMCEFELESDQEAFGYAAELSSRV